VEQDFLQKLIVFNLSKTCRIEPRINQGAKYSCNKYAIVLQKSPEIKQFFI